jgi:filamentous hemagglutinin family protein
MVVAAAHPAHAAPFRSLGAALQAHPSQAVISAQNGGGVTASQAAGLGAQNLAAAAARYNSLSAALAGGSYTGAPIPDGVGPGGLEQAPGVSSGGTQSTLWSGANTTLGTQTVNGVHDVTVTQTSSVADLTWQTFNIGAKTKLIFNQSKGGGLASTWIAINSVQDPLENPSTILGQISAPGKVFILNPNGVLFGAGSQVNVGSLIAATADIAQAQFTRDTNGLVKSFSLYGSPTGTIASSTFTDTFESTSSTGSIVVEAGAEIATPAPGANATGGFVMLLGNTVRNDGIIATPQGQTILAAGNNFQLQPGYSSSGNVTATVIGSQIGVTDNSGSTYGTGTTGLGSVSNTGIIMADQGDITMAGHSVTQAGILLSTTTVNNRGSIHLLTDRTDTTASIVLAPGSVTEVLPEDNGALALNSQRAADISNSASYNISRSAPLTNASLDTANTLPDEIGESRIEISSGGSVDVQGGALALAQGGQVAVGGSNIVLDTGSTLDVSGTHANLPASANSLFVQGIVPYYLRDSGANRTGGLEFANVYIDERTLVEIASGAYAGNIYTQGGLLEVSGNLGLIGHGIDEWSAIGGHVTLQGMANGGYSTGGTFTPGSVTVSQGATINLTGGTVSYAGGDIKQSYVITTGGRIYNINSAPGDLSYAGTYSGLTVDHARWQITDTYVNPLLTPQEIYQPAYTIGRDAGTLTVTAGSAALNGTVEAGVSVGTTQTGAHPSNVTDAFTLAQTVAPLAGALFVGDYIGGAFNAPFDTDIVVGSGTGGGKPVVNALPDTVIGTISIGAAALSETGFASITFSTAGDITVADPVALAAGGTLVVSGNIIEINSDITAHAGSVILTNLYPGSTDVNPVSTTGGSITLARGAVIDTTGEWTNLALDPIDAGGAAYANGGNVTVIGTGGVDLAAGATIDVSSGGVLSSTGKLIAASGGNISVSADIVPTQADTLQGGAITYDATFLGYASGSAGTLSLSAPYIAVGANKNYPDLVYVAGPGFFTGGFGGYALNGYLGLEVDAGLQLDIMRQIYELNNPNLATGGVARDAYAIVLPPLFSQVKGGDTLAQRAGASLTLSSSVNTGVYNGGGGAVTINAGAHITVDPKQSIMVNGYGQVTDYGTLTAHGGTITVANTRYEGATGENNQAASNYIDGLSVWIADQAVIDTSGEAVVFTDAQGRRYGQAQSGGAIFLGGLGGLSETSPLSTYAQVIVRPGAVLNVSGAAATVDASAGLAPSSIVDFDGPVTLAGNGGLIAARSYSGVALEGTMLAQGEGPTAAGGTLSMRLDPQNLGNFYGIPASYNQPSEIIISQNTVGIQTEPGLVPGDPSDPYSIGLGRVSQQQINAGGFDTLRLYAQDDISLDGNVALKLGGSITLESGIIGETNGNGSASITAPYVALIGYTGGLDTRGSDGLVQWPGATTATLTVNADLIDFYGALDLGGFVPLPITVPTQNGTPDPQKYASTFAFAQATFNSTGDIRFDGGPSGPGTLASSGNITFHAAQLYPTTSLPGTSTSATVIAGLDPYTANSTNQIAGGTITVLGLPGAAPPPPLSLGGTLALFADTVIQDGVVRAPEGLVELGRPRTSGDRQLELTDTVILGPNSITSVSLAGLDVPYGGTVDGVNYLYDGQAVSTFSPLVAIGAVQFTADPGALIDLRGGGTISGAGFIAGRGGSADVNKTPLLNSGSGTVTANTSDPVFAILPGYSSDYAPIAPADSGYSAPTEGEQITISAGEVPGLAAGTYTLLPAYYDLLPGAFRVELTTAPTAPGTAQPFGNFTTLAAVTVSTANTGFGGSTPTSALITSANGVRQLSQYDEESYSAFEGAASATFDAPRPLLPEDAKTLLVTLNTPTGTISGASAINIDPGTLLDAPAAGGYGATMEIAARGNDNGAAAIELLGPGDVLTQLPSGTGTLTFPTLGIDAATLSALDLPRLVIGGTLTTSSTTSNAITFTGVASAVVLEPDAVLRAGDVLLIANSQGGSIGVSTGATISTIGEPATAYGVAQGYYFTSDASGTSSPVLEVSSNQVIYTPSQSLAPGAAITVADGAVLDAGGSLNFVGPSGTSVDVGNADITARYVTVQVADINVGSAQNLDAFASLLPAGLTLSDSVFSALAAHATELILSADQAINFIGSIDLVSATTDLVLNTPAVYGYGIDGQLSDAGVVKITTPSITWGGVSVNSTLSTNGVTVISATPGGRISGSTADGTLTGAASLEIGGTQIIGSGSAAQTITTKIVDLGFGPEQRVNDQVMLDRLSVGFGDVILAASTEITANNQSALAVYDTQAEFGQPGAGGNLTLSAPLITAASGAVLDLTAGASLIANTGGAAPASTASVTTQGASIDLTAEVIATSTAIALPDGSLSMNAQQSIDLGSGTNIDLSGRATPIFDQTAESGGGRLTLQAFAGDGGTITEDAGATINVSAPGASAGSVSATASGGAVTFDGVIDGQGGPGNTGGSFTVFANTLGTSFDALNATLNAGGFTGLRSFELVTGDITVDQTITAHTVDISADTGSIDVVGTINASGLAPGEISLSAGQNVTLESGAVLDAHANGIAVDSYGNPIGADNRAHVTLTSVGGTVTLDGGATINVGYAPGNAYAAANPQGQVVINAPRLAQGAGPLEDVAVKTTGNINVIGADSIDLYGFVTYSPTDANGTIVQDNGSTTPVSPTGTIGIAQINMANAAWMQGVDADATGGTLASQLAGLAEYGSRFNVLPGVQITSTAASGGNLTISTDLDLSGLRYSDPVGLFGIATNGTVGSGEPGSLVFRASNDLTVNGSVSDGFLPPPDSASGTLTADTTGWQLKTGSKGGYEPTNADILLPEGAQAVYSNGGTPVYSPVYLVGLTGKGATTQFDTTRPISLNYPIVIQSAILRANTVIPFAVTVGNNPPAIPAGGWIATATVTRGGVVLFQPGQLIPAGFQFAAGDVLGQGTVLPVSMVTATGMTVPAGTSLQVFQSDTISLAANVELPVGALLPAHSFFVFGGMFDINGTPTFEDVSLVDLRPTTTIDGNQVQGYLYPLAQMMAPGSQSWSLDFVAGSDLGAADANTVQAASSLNAANGGVFAPPATEIDEAPGSLLIDDQHYYLPEPFGGKTQPVVAFSVIRTGTGDLSLVAGGNIDQSSLYGIYTAGTQDPLGGTADAQFNSARQNQGGRNLLPGDKNVSALIQSTYQAYYPNGGGDFLLAAQGDVTSDVFGDANNSTGASASDNVGNWLWRQGSTQLGQPTAWWINFGTLVAPLGELGVPAGPGVQMTGFVGFGALGGGNVTVDIGGDAGQMTARDEGASTSGASGAGPTYTRGEGLVIAVGGTGRLLPGSNTPITTGGGNISITIDGTLNPIDAGAYQTGSLSSAGSSGGQSSELASVNGDVIDLRGNISIAAGAIGRVDYQFDSGTSNLNDPRAADPFAYNNGVPNGGIEVLPGDGTVTIDTERDLVLGGAADPGRVFEQDVTSLNGYTLGDNNTDTGGYTAFSLWQPTTAISLFSGGGNVTPTTVPNQESQITTGIIQNGTPTDYRSIYPATLLVTAATGDIIYGQDGSQPGRGSGYTQYSLETMPAPNGQVEFLAGGSIIANGYAVDISGANPLNLSLPTDPAFTSDASSNTGETNIRTGIGTNQSPVALFALEADTVTTDLHADDPNPALFYAAGGDIVNFQSGETLYFGTTSNEPQSTWYIAAKPVWIRASNDIVSTGTRPDSYPNAATFAVQENQQYDTVANPNGTVNYWSSGNLFYNTSAASVSEIIAGRDILSAYAYVGGPGTLQVQAGRNLYQAAYSLGSQQVLSFGSLKSLGDNLIPGSTLNTTDGASINVNAGVGAAGPDYTAFATLFIDPANQDKISIPTADPASKAAVQAEITDMLVAILKQGLGYKGDAAGAYAYYQTLSAPEQNAVSRALFYSVLQFSGASEANPNSIYYKSYILGRQAIDTLFPSNGNETTPGAPVGYTGSITMYSGTVQGVDTASGTAATFDGGIATLFGGSVQVLDPGGATVFGITGGPAPGNSSGIVTYGAGSIDIYALQNVLLGQSRIFTTGGGNIVIWSSLGDINAGIGAKTTVVYNPPVLIYDDEGDITETPPASTSGAGIATLQPLPDVPAGDVNLIAPGGTIDAGEAGIRVSGNLVLAAARVVGTANISVKGATTGAPSVTVASLGAVEAAGAAAGAASSTAQSQGNKNDTSDAASVLDVEVISIGGSYDEEKKRRKQGI